MKGLSRNNILELLWCTDVSLCNFFELMNCVVQNYTPGNPAPVLYIKNLAKDVIADDFYVIFGELSRPFTGFRFCSHAV